MIKLKSPITLEAENQVLKNNHNSFKLGQSNKLETENKDIKLVLH